MSNLIAVAYPDVNTATSVADELRQLMKEQSIVLDDMVVVERRADGKVKLHQAGSPAAVGAAGGALWGGLIGLIFLVPLFGLAIGAATGAAAGALTDAGVDDKFMKELGTKLQPGGAAVIALVRNVNGEKLLAEVKIPGEVIQTSLSSEGEQRLREALESAGTAGATA